MSLEAAELLALALALEEDDAPQERAVEELAAAAEGSVVALSAAHAHAVSLVRELPYDEQAQRTVALLQHALQRVRPAATGDADEQTPEEVEEAESWLRAGRNRRTGGGGEGGHTVATRLARLAADAAEAQAASADADDARDRGDAGDLVADLERLRQSAVEEPDERRRTRWWRP